MAGVMLDFSSLPPEDALPPASVDAGGDFFL